MIMNILLFWKKNVELKNVELKDVELKNVELKNVELKNVELKNVELLNDYWNFLKTKISLSFSCHWSVALELIPSWNP